MSENSFNLNGSVSIAIVVLVSSFLSCLIPKYLSNLKMVRKYFSLINVFTAGLQLATIVVDLIPHMTYSESHSHSLSKTLPFVSIGAFFIALLSIDALFLHSEHKSSCHSTGKETQQSDVDTKTSSHQHSNCSHTHNHQDHAQHSHSHEHTNCSHTHKHRDHHNAVVENECHENIGTCNTSAISGSTSKTQALLMLLAVSVHSFFEGFAVESGASHLPLLMGLLLHKILESIAVGNSISLSKFDNWTQIFLITAYSLLTPTSILIRDLKMFKSNPAVQMWFYSFCLGSLMFVVFYEVIGHSFHGGKNTGKKICSISLGYLLGCIAVILAHSEHGHGSSGGHHHTHGGKCSHHH